VLDKLATSKAKCILALRVQLGGQSCVGASNAYYSGEQEDWLVGYSQCGKGREGIFGREKTGRILG